MIGPYSGYFEIGMRADAPKLTNMTMEKFSIICRKVVVVIIIINGDGGCGRWQHTGGLIAHWCVDRQPPGAVGSESAFMKRTGYYAPIDRKLAHSVTILCAVMYIMFINYSLEHQMQLTGETHQTVKLWAKLIAYTSSETGQ